ncbi:MAG: hypothetical protein UT30_C0009G0008 [Candidatus Uhrbacteria bacterium GW2011_GWF2_39_13]|uniref:Uncharacterized protein n=1 Tax=Candidatus Uhrbacteria bacterium GW2011_GWF2_39_13 TaxID=1618995 RepID=A0A0G0MMF1_9BACT|nr:MAG: hypothetical protein UT30_C0009G0008 [Candidatus Uhrbacteria bacterium GW2011_GWF2_39_13]HAU65763.1 hypothetical protein [Candidatus Uhrbacteria bacterium]
MNRACLFCKKQIEDWNEHCIGCGFHVELVPDEKIKARYLRGPSLGALFFTQGWAYGARLYVWFLLSLVPVFGIIVLFICLFFGRRLSWKQGGWNSWEEFIHRMRMMDILGGIWILLLGGLYVYFRLR